MGGVCDGRECVMKCVMEECVMGGVCDGSECDGRECVMEEVCDGRSV